jgi:hypothetical protein
MTQYKSHDDITILINELLDINVRDTQSFSFNSMESYAKVIKCFDFNTIEIIFKFNNIFIRYNCKINGIDDIQSKEKATKLTKKLESLILNKIVFIKFGKFDKFGRILIDITQNGKSISNEIK